MLNECRYQIGNPVNLPESIPAHRRAGQGRDGRYCFDGAREQ